MQNIDQEKNQLEQQIIELKARQDALVEKEFAFQQRIAGLEVLRKGMNDLIDQQVAAVANEMGMAIPAKPATADTAVRRPNDPIYQ